MRDLRRSRWANAFYVLGLIFVAGLSGLHAAFYALFTLGDVPVGASARKEEENRVEEGGS